MKTRHELLEKAIGVFPEEQDAYDLVMELFWILPTVVLVGAAVDAILVAIYMNFAHPWIKILKKPKNEQEGKDTTDKINPYPYMRKYGK